MHSGKRQEKEGELVRERGGEKRVQRKNIRRERNREREEKRKRPRPPIVSQGAKRACALLSRNVLYVHSRRQKRPKEPGKLKRTAVSAGVISRLLRILQQRREEFVFNLA